MRRPVRSLSAALLVAACCVATPAWAQDLQFRTVFSAGLQVTDNIRFSPMNPPAGQSGPVGGFTGDLNPQAILTYATPRSVNSLQYTFSFASVLGDSSEINYSNRVEASTRYEASERTNLTLALRGAQGQQAIFPDAQAGQATSLIVPGTFNFTSLEISEGITREMSEDVTFTQGLGGTLYAPFGPENTRPITYGVTSQLGVQYRDVNDTYGVTLSSQLSASSSADPLISAPRLTDRLGLTQRHDFMNGFVSELDLGAQQVVRLTDGGGQLWQPAGRAALRYDREEATVSLNFNHGMQLNVDVGGMLLTDSVDLIGTIPLDRETRRFVLAIQGGYQRGTPTDAASITPPFHLFSGDAALLFRPERWLPNFNAALRYQFRYQISESTGEGTATPYELHRLRNAVGLTVGFEYPERPPQ